MMSILLGPLILRKVGLEQYAVLSLAAYFLLIAMTYSDFGSYSHLLAAFSKKSHHRFLDVGCALTFKAVLLILFFCALAVFAFWHPRRDALYSFLAVSMIGLALPSMNVEWYLMAHKRYFHLFLSRIVLNGSLIVLLLSWFFSDWKNPVFVPVINLIAAAMGSLCLIWIIGRDRIRKGIACLRLLSFQGIWKFIRQLSPLAASQVFTPYFMAYALVWFSMSTPDRKLVGAFSLGYRLAMGFSALVGPFVLFAMPRFVGTNQIISIRKMLGLSLLAGIFFWMLGVPVLWLYFHVSRVDQNMLPYAIRTFSILMLGIFFLCLRTPYVARWLVSGRYKAYFLMLLISCAPVLVLSWTVGKKIPPGAVAWLACLPDFLATVIFIGYNRIRSLRGSFRAALSDR